MLALRDAERAAAVNRSAAETRGRCDNLPVTLKQKYYLLVSCNRPQRPPGHFLNWGEHINLRLSSSVVWTHHTHTLYSCVKVCVSLCIRLSNGSVLLQARLWISMDVCYFPGRNNPDCCQQMTCLQSERARHGHPKAPGFEPACWVTDRNWDGKQV